MSTQQKNIYYQKVAQGYCLPLNLNFQVEYIIEALVYNHILHATDLSENHFKMCQQAAEIAKSFKSRLYLLHVIQPPPSLQLAQGLGFAEFDKPVKEDAISVLKIVGEALKIPSAQQFVEVGSIKMHVLEKAAILGCDLIIVGSHTNHKLPSFLGSTAHAVVNHAKCDVLTLRG